MPNSDPHEPSGRAEQRDIFATTSWTAIAAAQSESAEAREALEKLCSAYWFPLYAYVRHRGYSPADAEDLTQGFFYFFLSSNRLRVVDRAKGKFRAFLLATLKGYLANQWTAGRAAKRGGGKIILSLDEETAEHRYIHEPVSKQSPEAEYERRWASEVMQHALTRLESDFAKAGKQSLFNELRGFLLDEGGPADTVAKSLNMTRNALTVAVHRLRQSYRNRLREEVARTVASPEEVEVEMRHLFNVLARC
jgi:DNA-directed RNA polymerase specialized sigma24 family protein